MSCAAYGCKESPRLLVTIRVPGQLSEHASGFDMKVEMCPDHASRVINPAWFGAPQPCLRATGLRARRP